MKEGREQVLADVAIELLMKKNKKVSMDVRRQIQRSDATTLRILVKNVMDFESIEEVQE